MKELAELKDLMAELLDGEIQYEPEMAVTERGKEIINEIADYAETTELFRKEHHHGDLMLQGMTFREVFASMLDRVCNAPTILHVTSSVILLMPFVRDAMMKYPPEVKN